MPLINFKEALLIILEVLLFSLYISKENDYHSLIAFTLDDLHQNNSKIYVMNLKLLLKIHQNIIINLKINRVSENQIVP